MDPCARLATLLWQYLDRELDPGAYEALAEHVRLCRECSRRADFEIRLRALLQEKCGRVSAPERLRLRLMEILERT